MRVETAIDCKTVVFFSKSVKKSVKRDVGLAREAREPHTPNGRVRREKKRVSLSVFSLVPDLFFDCSRVLEYAKIRTVLQSKTATSLLFSLKRNSPSFSVLCLGESTNFMRERQRLVWSIHFAAYFLNKKWIQITLSGKKCKKNGQFYHY